MTKLINPKKISLEGSREISETVIQNKIAEDPAIIGLGNLVLKDKERTQLRAGRLDLLLQDPDTNRRYEVEIQLGKTDESHIIRTIEYWDIERRRYPQYDHCAVIIAENITSRFLNVISLFNGYIPLIAIQINALEIGEDVGLIFTTVLDELPLGLVDEDEEVKEITDRKFWLSKGSEQTVRLVDSFLEIINSFASGYELKYNKFYIGMAKNGQPNNFAVFRPRKAHVQVDIKLPLSEETTQLLDDSQLDNMGYDKRYGNYRLRVSKGEVKQQQELFKQLLQRAEEEFN